MSDEFLELWSTMNVGQSKADLMQATLKAFEHEVKVEREACIKLCESSAESFKISRYNDAWCGYADAGAASCAGSIRARGDANL